MRVILPRRPSTLASLLDACIIFLPEHFAACPTLIQVEQRLERRELFDFGTGWMSPKEL